MDKEKTIKISEKYHKKAIVLSKKQKRSIKTVIAMGLDLIEEIERDLKKGKT